MAVGAFGHGLAAPGAAILPACETLMFRFASWSHRGLFAVLG